VEQGVLIERSRLNPIPSRCAPSRWSTSGNLDGHFSEQCIAVTEAVSLHIAEFSTCRALDCGGGGPADGELDVTQMCVQAWWRPGH